MDAHKISAVQFIGIVETPPCMQVEWHIHLLFITQAHNAPDGAHRGSGDDGLMGGASVCSELAGFWETGLFASVRGTPPGVGFA